MARISCYYQPESGTLPVSSDLDLDRDRDCSILSKSTVPSVLYVFLIILITKLPSCESQFGSKKVSLLICCQFTSFFRYFFAFDCCCKKSSIDTVTNVTNVITVAERKRLLDFAVHLFLEDKRLHINMQSLVTHLCPVGGVFKVILYKSCCEQSIHTIKSRGLLLKVVFFQKVHMHLSFPQTHEPFILLNLKIRFFFKFLSLC